MAVIPVGIRSLYSSKKGRVEVIDVPQLTIVAIDGVGDLRAWHFSRSRGHHHEIYLGDVGRAARVRNKQRSAPGNNADALPLVNQMGVGASLGALKGKYLVIAPFLTICQEVCPMVSTGVSIHAKRLISQRCSEHSVLPSKRRF
jgi:hypothetical protein